MEIQEFHVVVRARDFERSRRFYSGVLGLPCLETWDGERGRGALFAVGSGRIELLGRPRHDAGSAEDASFELHGPAHKTTLELVVHSAERAYEDLIFRDRNIPGGLKKTGDGRLVFETRDPDGLKIAFVEAEPAAERDPDETDAVPVQT